MKQHDGYGAGYDPEKDHPLAEGRAADKGTFESSPTRTSKALPQTPTSKDTHKDTHGHGSGHKSKFMDRVRGEAKIIAGKLGGNEEKVEEGKRMKGKE
jgi:hypothetical protein